MISESGLDYHHTRAMELYEILKTDAIRTHFQPIVNLRDGSVLGYEALSRGPIGSILESPLELFQDADNMGLTWELEYTCRRLAIERFAKFNSQTILFLNINPHIINDPRFHDGMTKEHLDSMSMPASRVVLELTERKAVTNYAEFTFLLEHYKKQGFRLAVDDVGVGYSGLNLICEVKPRFIKLDRSLISNINHDAFKQQLVKFTIDFARATDITVIAEGVEHEAELLILLELGIEYAQGFLFARPQPTLSFPPEDMVDRLKLTINRRLSNKLKHMMNSRVGNLCRAVNHCASDMRVLDLEALFNSDENIIGMPIVDDGIPKGIVMRDKFYSRLGSQYGYSLFHHRSVNTVMDSHPLIVDFHDSLEETSLLAMQRTNSRLYDHIIVTLQGMYFGIITVHDLLERIAEQGVNNAQQANPLTGLPGNAVIQYQIEHVLNSGKEFSVLYLDLDNFKAYNDVYGFDRGDAILQFLAELIQSALSNIDIEDSFIGHLGGDDFVAVLNQRIDQTVLDNLLLAFDARILEYYDEEDRQRGYIYTTNRRGNYEKFPFISLSIAVVTEDNGVFDGYHSVAKRASDVKKRCKAVAGSCYFFDRRN